MLKIALQDRLSTLKRRLLLRNYAENMVSTSTTLSMKLIKTKLAKSHLSVSIRALSITLRKALLSIEL